MKDRSFMVLHGFVRPRHRRSVAGLAKIWWVVIIVVALIIVVFMFNSAKSKAEDEAEKARAADVTYQNQVAGMAYDQGYGTYGYGGSSQYGYAAQQVQYNQYQAYERWRYAQNYNQTWVTAQDAYQAQY